MMPMTAHQSANHEGCPPLAGILLAGAVVCGVLVIHAVPGLAEILQWQRGSGPGRSLTWLTSHLCHWSWNHLVWDLLAFAILSFLCLRLLPSHYAACLLVAAVVVPLEVSINQPQLTSYRGLSGLDAALIGLVVAALWRQSHTGRHLSAPRILAIVGGIGFLAKVLYEGMTGGTVFVENANVAFVPVVSAHLVGFVCGVGVGLLKRDHGPAAAVTGWQSLMPGESGP